MANIRSQIKRNAQNEKRRLRNRATRSELRTRVKLALAAPAPDEEDGDAARDEALRVAVQRIDKAAAKGVIHPNAAARKKSRLMRRVAASAGADGA